MSAPFSRAAWAPLALGAAAFVATSLGEVPVAAAAPGDELTISVLTFGPGDHPFFKFGHNAILVHDDVRRADWVYNYGTFGFESPLLVVDFLKGKLRYWLSVQSLRGTIAAYKRENRTIDAQELNLTGAQKLELKRRLELNARDENKYYKYDYYRDNCSTRVRDPIDAITDGSVKAVAVGTPAQFSWRGHTQRLVADSPAFYFALHVAMGDVIDKKIDVWEEMFLPAKLQETLRKARVTLPCAEGAPPSSCGEQPLVKAERHLLTAQREPLRTAPPSWTLRCLLVGLLAGSVFAFLGDRARAATSKAPRVAFGALLSGFGALFGLLGCIFVMFWVATDHEVAWHNENILQCAPWLIVVGGSGIGVALGKARSIERAKKLVTAAAVAAFAGLLLKVLPMFDQDNAQIMAFTIPLWAGAALGLHRMTSVDGPRVMTPIGVPVKAGASAPPPPPQEDEDEAVQPEGGDADEAAGPPAKASTPPKTSAPPAAAPSADTAEEGSGQEPVPA
jgi:hypothetical protein